MACYFSKEFSSNQFIDIENAFITEYLSNSDGNAVKVYLYGLYLCNNPNLEQNLDEFAMSIGLTKEEALKGLKYWEDFGILSLLKEEPLTIEYLPVKDASFNKPRKYKAEKYTEFSKALQTLITGRMIYTNEFVEYYSIMEIYKILPEAMLLIVKYCVDKKGNDIGFHYISKVAKDFGAKGLITVDKVEKELSSYLLKTREIENIFKAMSLKRSPDIEDLNLFKKWTTELEFDPESIVFAASKIKKGGMAKLDEFIHELYSMKSFTKQEISNFIDRKKFVFDLTIKINKALSVYVEVIDTVIDTYTNKWLSYGYEEEALLFIASTCFKQGKNTLKDMDELVEQLRLEGIISLSSVGDYFENEKKTEDFIKQVLLTCGLNRRPTRWDKDNLKVWKGWNFSDEMIIEASKISAGKSSPISYMNGVLSNWKNNGVFTISSITDIPIKQENNSQEAYNREYEKRRYLALSKAQKNTDIAMEIEGFSAIYERLFGIEKDLAFAEISGNSEALANLENEKADLTNKGIKLLSTKGLDFSDLSPKFKCEKCKDTGYVGTSRCDCYEKFKD